jgi:NAD(P)-dependent dehydrogenase (short-subunit alcohol dehydrogenase family)
MRLDGKIAVVTGASSGIGRATAELFAEQGATVVACDIGDAPGYAAERIEARHLDVSELAEWEALAASLGEKFEHVDILVNNAGVVHTYAGIDDVTIEDWNHVLGVNLNGVFFGMRAIVPLMRQNGGSIVNVSSIWGIGGAAGLAPYQASKAAVRHLSKSAALTYVGDGIRVNSLHPGLVMTPMIEAQADDVTQGVIDATPMGRAAEPRELANGMLFLASDESSFMTGAELVIDGGYLVP